MFELVGGLVRVFADPFAQHDSPFVEEDVPLHRLEAQFAQSVPFPFGPHAESALEQQPAQLGQTSLLVTLFKTIRLVSAVMRMEIIKRPIFLKERNKYLVAGDGDLVHTVVDASQNGQHGVQGQLEIVFTADIF